MAGASAYPREIAHGKFAEIADEVGAKLMVDMAHYAGLVAAGLHDNPVPGGGFCHDAPRTRRCAVLARDYASAGKNTPRDLDRSVFPGTAGRAADACRLPARRSVLAKPCSPTSKQYAQQIIDNCEALAEALARGRSESGQRRYGQPSGAGRRDTAGIGGKIAEQALESCGITVNKNMIPFDERKPMDPSGIRIGTPA